MEILRNKGMTQAMAGTVFHEAYLKTQREYDGEGLLFPTIRSFPGGAAPKPPKLHYDLRREMGRGRDHLGLRDDRVPRS